MALRNSSAAHAGFVPLGVPLPIDAPPLLAVGGHLKNVFALARGRFVYQSQHLGDLENLTGLDFFRESLDHLMRTFEIEPRRWFTICIPATSRPNGPRSGPASAACRSSPCSIITPMSPDAWPSTAFDGPVIGLSLDGTGYGTDGRIWGGEVLIAPTGVGFERFAHLDTYQCRAATRQCASRGAWRSAHCISWI